MLVATLLLNFSYCTTKSGQREAHSFYLFHDSLCSIFFTRSSSPRRLLTSNWISRGGTRTSYPCQLMVSNRLAATGPYSVSPFSSTSSLTPPIHSIRVCNKALPNQ